MNIYKCLNTQEFISGEYKIVPIRLKDRFTIMVWRNEQLYHLRQKQPLTAEDQDIYFSNVVSKIFDVDQPDQILFSFLENETCVGYGGLVHIDWKDKNAEISFIMDTKLEKDSFEEIWLIYLDLIEQVAFNDLKFIKIYTYAFDLRPNLFKVLETSGFKLENNLKNIQRSEKGKVVVHSKQRALNKLAF
jgi:hypothetical protein